MSDLLNKVITVKAKEEKSGPFGPMVKIKDQDGKTYSVFKTKKDGTVSVAWENMPSLEDTVQIGYAEEDKEYEGKPYKQRTVRSFNADIGNGVANAKVQDKPQQSESRNWDKEAYEKCCSIWAQGITLESALGHLERGDFWNLFQAIKADGEKRFNTWNQLGEKLKTPLNVKPFDKGWNKEEVAEDIKEMADEMEASVEDIPF